MSHIKCLNGPAKGFEADIESPMKVGDVVFIPMSVRIEVDGGRFVDGQKYEDYAVSGFIGENYLLTLAKLEPEPANDDQ